MPGNENYSAPIHGIRILFVHIAYKSLFSLALLYSSRRSSGMAISTTSSFAFGSAKYDKFILYSCFLISSVMGKTCSTFPSTDYRLRMHLFMLLSRSYSVRNRPTFRSRRKQRQRPFHPPNSYHGTPEFKPRKKTYIAVRYGTALRKEIIEILAPKPIGYSFLLR